MNDVDTMPIKCKNCPYWEIAEKPYNCIECEERVNNAKKRRSFNGIYYKFI